MFDHIPNPEDRAALERLQAVSEHQHELRRLHNILAGDLQRVLELLKLPPAPQPSAQPVRG